MTTVHVRNAKLLIEGVDIITMKAFGLIRGTLAGSSAAIDRFDHSVTRAAEVSGSFSASFNSLNLTALRALRLLPPDCVRLGWLRWLGFREDPGFLFDAWTHPFFGRITFRDALERWF